MSLDFLVGCLTGALTGALILFLLQQLLRFHLPPAVCVRYGVQLFPDQDRKTWNARCPELKDGRGDTQRARGAMAESALNNLEAELQLHLNTGGVPPAPSLPVRVERWKP